MFPSYDPPPSMFSSANIVYTVQNRFQYDPHKSQQKKSNIIQNVFHTLKINLKQYKIAQEKLEIKKKKSREVSLKNEDFWKCRAQCYFLPQDISTFSGTYFEPSSLVQLTIECAKTPHPMCRKSTSTVL